jgi:hypothetical protein
MLLGIPQIKHRSALALMLPQYSVRLGRLIVACGAHDRTTW